MQSIWLDSNSSKGISEESAKALDVSLNQIYTHPFGGGRTIIIGQTTDSGGGGVTESISSELKIMVALVSYIVSSNSACTPNIRHCRKLWKTDNTPTGYNM